MTEVVYPARTRSVERHDEAGVTLVELLVAIVIMGVLFAGVAGALINFSKAAVNNERRVQSSGLLNSSQEQLQTIDWDLAALYEDEVNDPATLARLNHPQLQGSASGFEKISDDDMRFDGEELVLLDGPPGDPPARQDLVPEPYVQDGDFEIFTFITWAEDIGDGTRAKRFTTIVRWTVFNQPLYQRFQSFRAPTSQDIEASAPLEVTQFNLAPSQIVIDLDEDDDGVKLTTGTTLNDSSVSVRFNRPVDGDVWIGYYPHGVVPDPDEDVTQSSEIVSIELAPDPTTFSEPGGFTRFFGTLPAGSGPFEDDPDVPVTLYVWGTSGGETATQQLAMTFTSDADFFRPEVTAADVSPEVNVKNVGGQDQLCGDVVLTATVEGLEPDGYVVATYSGEGGGTGVGLFPQGVVTSEPTSFARTFEKGSRSRWDPGNGNNATDTITFEVKAVNPGNYESVFEAVSLTVRRVGGNAPC